MGGEYGSETEAQLEAARVTRLEVEKAVAAERAEIAFDIAENPNNEWTKDLRRQLTEMREALTVLKSGLSAKCQESGDFWAARDWLKDRDIYYEGDLTGERVLLEVAKAALASTSEQAETQ